MTEDQPAPSRPAVWEVLTHKHVLSGLMFANSVFVSPTMFSLPVSGQIIIWVIIGGLGTLIGPVIGCILMQLLTNWLGTLNQVPGFAWVDPHLVLGVILVIFVLLVPKGLTALVADTYRWLAGRTQRTNPNLSPGERAERHEQRAAAGQAE